MRTSTDAERGQVPTEAARIYEEFFVPALFGQWTAVVLDAAGVVDGDRVLDLGCGTGALAREASRRVGDGGEVVGLDPNPGMLAVAAGHPEPVTWRSGVAEDVPFADDRFDRFVSQFAWMFLDDPARAAAEAARVLAPGGTLAIATWGALEQTPGYAAMVQLLAEHVGEDAAAALRAPYCLGDPTQLAEVLADSFPDVVVERHEGTARFRSVEDWLYTDIRGWTLGDMVDEATFQQLLDVAPAALQPYTSSGGQVSFPAPALVATASMPSSGTVTRQ